MTELIYMTEQKYMTELLGWEESSVKMTTTKAIYRFSAIPIKLKRMKYKHTRGKKIKLQV